MPVKHHRFEVYVCFSLSVLILNYSCKDSFFFHSVFVDDYLGILEYF